MDDFISISTLNDFIFCPYSIYLHNVYQALEEDQFHETPQTAGKQAHESIDHQTHDTNAHILLGTSVTSLRLRITGKIDQFDIRKKCLTERKRQIKEIYDGYKLQLYAQYFCLLEMGYEVETLRFYSLSTNKVFPLELPDENITAWFEQTLETLRSYDPSVPLTNINPNKCKYCVYRALCDQVNETEI